MDVVGLVEDILCHGYALLGSLGVLLGLCLLILLCRDLIGERLLLIHGGIIERLVLFATPCGLSLCLVCLSLDDLQ